MPSIGGKEVYSQSSVASCPNTAIHSFLKKHGRNKVMLQDISNMTRYAKLTSGIRA